jgi:hypothetical protein
MCTSQAQQELQELNVIIQQSTLSDQPDTRLSAFSRTRDKLDTSAIYRLLKAKGQENYPYPPSSRRTLLRSECSCFSGYFSKGECRSNLYRKKIVESPACSICGTDDEMPDHIILQCPIAVQFWSAIGL